MHTRTHTHIRKHQTDRQTHTPDRHTQMKTHTHARTHTHQPYRQPARQTDTHTPKKPTRVAAHSLSASLGRPTVCGRTEQRRPPGSVAKLKLEWYGVNPTRTSDALKSCIPCVQIHRLRPFGQTWAARRHSGLLSSTKHQLSGRRSPDCRRINHLRPTGSRTPIVAVL